MTAPKKLRVAVVCLALAAATLFVYSRVGTHRFLDYDDVNYVLENRAVRAGLTLEGVRWALTTLHASNWHPLTWVSHMLDMSLFGPDSGRQHQVNALLHTAAGVLLFLALMGMTGRLWPSAFVAGLFALHPLHVESVAWLAERKDVLLGFCLAVTLLAYLWYLRRPGGARFALVFISCLLAVMTKPMAVTLPLLMLLLDVWPLGRTGTARGTGGNGDLATAGRLVREKFTLLMLSGLSSFMTLRAQTVNDTLVPLSDVSLGERLANAAVSLVIYVGKTVWPASLAVFYPFPQGGTPAWQAAAAAVVVAGASLAALQTVRKYPYMAVGWFWFLTSLIPVLGLVQVGYQARADRYTYLPLIGLFTLLAWGASEFADRQRIPRKALAAGGALVLILFGLMARHQVGYWKDGISLFQHALDVTADNWQSRFNLGHAYLDEGRTKEAVSQIGASLRMNPENASALNTQGLALSKLGRFDEAIPLLQRAISLDPYYPDPYFNLGMAYLGTGERKSAWDTCQALGMIDPVWQARLLKFLNYSPRH